MGRHKTGLCGRQTWLEVIISFRNLGNNILWKKLISLNSVWKNSVREVVFMEAMAELSHKTKES